ncbi:Protein RETICULATA-RELATED 4, chloroplastic [Ananas comosus]|uniref:Protein RETICULATA-RELATED 4, chloroplastic n=1 Tax=Ananas comosus TaxID=4615 RepID=A0A199W0C0_ANACO|nr:Protein RETICULATA-RELATED 4, chloroplastic [Ananas comosus]
MATSSPSYSSLIPPILHRPSPLPTPSSAVRFPAPAPSLRRLRIAHRGLPLPLARSSGGGNGGGHGGGDGGGGGGEEDFGGKNRAEAMLVLAEMGRGLESLPQDLAAAVEAGRIPGEIVRRFAELEKSPVLRWLLRFGGFKERLLADDLFLTKVAIECGVGIFTKTAAEWERRRDKFPKELDFVFADVVMAIIADFMLVWLPAPTVSLKPPLALSAGPIAKFFYSCPDNAFQIGTGITNVLINIRKAFDKDFASEAEDVPVLSTSVAYGVYMAVSSNLRYQILAGIIEQRMLEPLLHNRKLALSAMCFAVRTGNTFLGSLMWVDYARWIGIQKIRE